MQRSMQNALLKGIPRAKFCKICFLVWDGRENGGIPFREFHLRVVSHLLKRTQERSSVYMGASRLTAESSSWISEGGVSTEVPSGLCTRTYRTSRDSKPDA